MSHSIIRNSMYAAALTLACAAIPVGQVAAQETGSSMHSASDNQTVPDKAADAWITTKVKSEFGTTKGISATDISVTTNDGMVTLTGTAESQAEKDSAERVAKAVKGVKSVNSSGLTVSAAH